MSAIFLSYAREDRAHAEWFANEFTRRGWSVWWDRNIHYGKSFSKVIEQQLNLAQCVIVLWSRASIESDWVLNEAVEGASRNILLPVRIDDVRVPLQFRHLHTADLIGDITDEQLRELAGAITELVPPRLETGPPVEHSAGHQQEQVASRSTRDRLWSAMPQAVWVLLGAVVGTALALLLWHSLIGGTISKIAGNADRSTSNSPAEPRPTGQGSGTPLSMTTSSTAGEEQSIHNSKRNDLPIYYSAEIVARIIKNPGVPLPPNHPTLKRTPNHDMIAIILHYAGTPDNAAATVLRNGRPPELRGPLAHWLVKSDGVIESIAPEEQKVNHVGRASNDIANSNSIGVETSGTPAFADQRQIENLVRIVTNIAD